MDGEVDAGRRPPSGPGAPGVHHGRKVLGGQLELRASKTKTADPAALEGVMHTMVSHCHYSFSHTIVPNMSNGDSTFDVHLQELRRGTVVLGCLRLLLHAPGYGYHLLEQLQDHGLAVDGNTLYPLLRRLEKQGFLTSEWQAADPRPRKFYRTSRAGEELAEALEADWRRLTAAVDSLTEES